MEKWFLFGLELLGTAAFAVSGAMTALQKRMDVFGVAILGVTTAVGGGVLRDVLTGSCPPALFRDPTFALAAVVVSLVIFLPSIRRLLAANARLWDLSLLLADSVGLGIFAVMGVNAAYEASLGTWFATIFLGTITGVGGGLLRDVMAGNTPYIFVKHIYACAAIAGTALCRLLWTPCGKNFAMAAGAICVVALRLLAAHYRWSLPKATAMQD